MAPLQSVSLFPRFVPDRHHGGFIIKMDASGAGGADKEIGKTNCRSWRVDAALRGADVQSEDADKRL